MSYHDILVECIIWQNAEHRHNTTVKTVIVGVSHKAIEVDYYSHSTIGEVAHFYIRRLCPTNMSREGF